MKYVEKLGWVLVSLVMCLLVFSSPKSVFANDSGPDNCEQTKFLSCADGSEVGSLAVLAFDVPSKIREISGKEGAQETEKKSFVKSEVTAPEGICRNLSDCSDKCKYVFSLKRPDHYSFKEFKESSDVDADIDSKFSDDGLFVKIVSKTSGNVVELKTEKKPWTDDALFFYGVDASSSEKNGSVENSKYEVSLCCGVYDFELYDKDGNKIAVASDVEIRKEKFAEKCFSCEAFKATDSWLESLENSTIDELIKKFEDDKKNRLEEIKDCVSEIVLDDRNLTNANGQKVIDFLNQCYVDTLDGDGDGVLCLVLFSYRDRPDSIFYNIPRVRVKFFDENGSCVLTKIATRKIEDAAKLDAQHGNSFSVNKFEIEFGKKYKLHFYDADSSLDDEKVLATYDLEVLKPKKPSNISDYKFGVSRYSGGSSLVDVESFKPVSDRVFLQLKRAGFETTAPNHILKLYVVCNLLNEDSVFKNSNSLVCEFVDKNGQVIKSAHIDSFNESKNCRQCRWAKLELPVDGKDFDISNLKFVKFYDVINEEVDVRKLKAVMKLTTNVKSLMARGVSCSPDSEHNLDFLIGENV